MKPINTAERRKRFFQFGVLYLASLCAVAATFLLLFRGKHELFLATSFPNNASASPQRTIDSLWKALSAAEDKLLERDSLVTILRGQPRSAIPPVPGNKPDKSSNDEAADRRLMGDLKHLNSLERDSINRLMTEKAAVQQKLDDTEKASETLSEQVANLRHSTETLQARLKESTNSTSTKQASFDANDMRIKALASDNAALEKHYAEMSDQLSFAEVDCNLSRADARQAVYNDRQRQDLLMNALRILNDLSKSPDPAVQRVAKQKLILLKNIAGMVHD